MMETKAHNLLSVISCILQHVVEEQDKNIAFATVSCFTSQHKPGISIYDYLQRLCTYSHCGSEPLIFSLIYIDRLIQSQAVAVNSLSIHRILVTSLVIATKYLEDVCCVNSYFAKIGGLQTREINLLESEFLHAICFSLYVSQSDYAMYFFELCHHADSGICPNCYGLCFSNLLEEEDRAYTISCDQLKAASSDSPVNVVCSAYEEQ